MHGPDALRAFYLALAETPGDPVTLLALSDWYDEQGDSSAAECVRWSARKKRWPFQYHRGTLAVHSDTFHDGWLWWANDDPLFGADWGHSLECRLQPRLWKLLRRPHDITPLVVKEYETVQLAYEALIAAWPRAQLPEVPPRRQERPW